MIGPNMATTPSPPPNMTNISTDQSDFDFWEFVACAKCQLSFSLDAGTAVPFWLTQCGHVICNNHLNPDQSCSQCGSQEIQLAPLQREMDAPMSHWFSSVSTSLDSASFTAKFQQETMASQIRYFKSRYQQLKHFVERLKRDIADLKKANGVLQNENDQFRMQRHDDQVPSNTFNANGKRQMSTHQFDYSNRRPTTNSNPHSIPTPLGPNRLTLAPGQQLPELSPREQHNNPELSRSHAHGQENQGHFANTSQQRPISSRSLEQYAYVPPDTPKFQVQQLSYPHADPKTFQNTNQSQTEVPQQGRSQNQGQTVMTPATSRFTPAPGSGAQFPTKGQAFLRQTNMGPPPTPQRFRPHKSNTTDNLSAKNTSTNHLLQVPALSRRQQLQNTDTTIPGASQQQSFNATSQRFFQVSTSNPRRSNSRPSLRGDHRMPFVPEGDVNGFS